MESPTPARHKGTTLTSSRGAGVELACLEAGPADAPILILEHGFPDTAETWLGLVPALVASGRRVVAPWLRGYPPSGRPADGSVLIADLAADVLAVADALSPERPVELVGHDWGGAAVVAAAALAPARVGRVASLAIPHPGITLAAALRSYEQLKRSWYMFFFQLRGIADATFAADDAAMVERLWRDWSPGLPTASGAVAGHLAAVRRHFSDPDAVEAALDYYRQNLDPTRLDGRQTDAVFGRVGIPALFAGGRDDGCLDPALLAQSAELCDLPPRVEILDGCGHFLHLERPAEVSRVLLDFLGKPEGPG